MLTAVCLNKLAHIIAIVIIIIGGIQFSYQFKVLQQTNDYPQSGLKIRAWLKPGQQLVFATTTTLPPVVLKPGQELIFITTTANPLENSRVFVNNQPTVATLAPFIPSATTPTPEFLSCFIKCPTTSEFNPICASNRQLYSNEQKFNCAKQCGADIKIVRYGSCEGLFPMTRG